MRLPIRMFYSLLWALYTSMMPLGAQDFYYERLPAELGLSQNMVNCVYQDRKGFLWVGTNNGLNRFDGYRFSTFRYDPFDPASIPGSSVSAIYEDDQNRLWVSTERGICWFDPAKEAFFPLPVASNSYPLEWDTAGNIWQGSIRHGLLGIIFPEEPSAFKLEELRYIRCDSSMAQQSFMTPLWIENGHALTFSSEKGAYHLRFNPSENKIYLDKNFDWITGDPSLQQVVGMLLEMDSASRNFLRGFERDREGRIWLSFKKQLLCWNLREKNAVEFIVPDSVIVENVPADLRWGVLSTIVLDRRNRLWAGGFNGTFLVDIPTKTIQPLRNRLASTEHPMYYGVGSFFEDQGGLMWIGTKGKGLVKYNEFARRFTPGLWTGASIRALHKTTDGLIWFSTPSGTLHCVNPKTKQVKEIAKGQRWNGLEIGEISCLYQDPSGALWAGSGNQGMMKLQNWAKGEPDITMVPFDKSIDMAAYLGPSGIVADKNGIFWLSSKFGVIRFDPRDGSREIIPFFGSDLSRITENRFATIQMDRSERIWVGTSEGLWLLDYPNKSFKKYQNDRANPQSLPHNQIKCITLDPVAPERYLWVGTGGGGLSKFDIQLGVFEHFTEKDGLPDMVVYAVLPDSVGNLWLSTNKGLSVFNPGLRTFRNFDQSDGLQNLEFNTLAYSIAYDGEFLFGGIEGINRFYPGQMLNTNRHVPEIVFTDFKISGKSVSHKTPGSPLKESIAYARRIVLTHNQKVISFDFAALDYADPSKNQFSCKMDGFDKDWQPLGTAHSATYTNLSPGTYVFRVRGSNNDGVWNMQGAQIEIVVLAPWWATWWAWTIYCLSAFGIVYAFYRLQINRNKARAEASRLQELNNAKSLFLTTVSHELRTPLTSIMGFSKIIKKRVEERLMPNLDRSDPRTGRAAEQVISNLDIVVSESERLTALINNVLDLSKIESGKTVWREETVDINLLIDRALLTASALLGEKNIALYKKVEDDLPAVQGDNDRLLQVLVNLFSNAVKFTEEGAITVLPPGYRCHFKVEILI